MSERDAFLKLARDRFKQAEDSDKSQRERELADLSFYAGEQWDKGILESRKGQTLGTGSSSQIVPARPCLVINKTREPVRQVLNQERQSDMGIELIPADDFGEMSGPIDHTEIELREGLVRRIQRDSEAADARTWAFSRSAIAGRGYWLVMTRYVPGKTSDQEVYVERIYNQASVLLDPAHQQPDGSDADWGFYGTDLPIDSYKAQHKSTAEKHNRVATAATDDEWRALGDEAPGWFKNEGETRSVRVMNYYYTERDSRELAMFEDGRAEWVDELPDGTDEQTYTTRSVETKTIKWAKIDGAQVLDETDWPGHYIPIIKVVGEELQPYDTERRCEGIVRPMRSSCQGNNYIISKFVERVGLTPITPIMMAGGQDEGYEDEYNALNTRTLSRVHYNQKDNFNAPAPVPFRPDMHSEIADIGMGLQIFGQAIQSTSVMPETAFGHTASTVKSGKMAKALIEQAERGTSNFLDNLVRSMRHEARIINDLLYPIYGLRPGRLARMMNPKGDMSAVLIGQPFTMQGQGKKAQPTPIPAGQPQPPEAKTYQLTDDAEFNVAIRVTKNQDTRRREIFTTLVEIVGNDPNQMLIIGDKLWEYADLPDHEDMEKRYRAMLAPPVQAVLNGGQAPSNPADQQKMQMMTEEMQKLQEQADKNKTALLGKQMDNASKKEIEIIRVIGQLTAVQAKVDAEDARTFIDAMENRLGKALDLHLEHLGHAHEAQQAGHDRTHDVNMALLTQQHALQQGQQDQAHALEQGDQGHAQALAQGEQGQVHALEQGQQQAALAPQPEAGA